MHHVAWEPISRDSYINAYNNTNEANKNPGQWVAGLRNSSQGGDAA